MQQFWTHSLSLWVSGGATVVSGVAVIVSLYGAVVAARNYRRVRDAITDTSLESRLKTVAASMARASELLVLVQTEIQARAAKAKQLAEEVERGEQLALLTQPQKDAVAAVLRAEVSAEGRRSIWWTVGISVLTFVFGSAVTVLVTLLVHPLH
ncbi:hypothetical protein B8W69_16160 [Mycobacterium vulneris]|uniref:Uncharacterized protein n=1 Tax=Mycolicibacterium vulneris TaxID=547163 RepID=A0A1X2KZR1_9MYCO|nr:hypothetical protein [Mycolicibacterium vulneris]OSC26733.1 hypothetical protein B8W69_16160 [Mycolicibacterium vulneris]